LNIRSSYGTLVAEASASARAISDSSSAKSYFQHVRTEIAPLLPTSAKSIVDVGAGAGHTAAWLRSRYPGSHATALEGNGALRDELARNVDRFCIVDLNGHLPDVGSPDLILFLDVLEHLARPDEVLRHLTATMADRGTVIVSLPNVAHLSVSVPLLFGARFDYGDAGILDRTHLRFFVRDTAVTLMNEAGLIVRRGIRSGFEGPRARMLDRVTAGLVRDHLTKQYIIAGTRATNGARQGAVEWLVA
jgi:2-polyprenyl-3-methyl-5-hydroxy-6-metoxy-1,4-benzoquinol methylase